MSVFVNVGISLDGFVAGTNRGPKNPIGDRGPSLHAWMFKQRAFRASHGLEAGGETGADNAILEHTVSRIGANIMGKRMFEEGVANWGETPPFHNSVFVLTHEKREPWVWPGGTTYFFTSDPLEVVLQRAREAAGKKDVRICGGANLIVQYLNAGLVDELELAIAPVFMGEGLRLFDGIDRRKIGVEIREAIHSADVTHVRYLVKKR